MHTKNFIKAGTPFQEAEYVLIMIHGRGGSASDMLQLSKHLNIKKGVLIAPQATDNTWYPYSFMAPVDQNEPWLTSALEMLQNLEKEIIEKGFSSEKIFFLGFSQGACLTLEYAARNAKKYGGVIAFTGGLIGAQLDEQLYQGDFLDTPVYIGTSDPDPHVPVSRVKETQLQLDKMHACTTVDIVKNMGHTIIQEEIDRANQILPG